ncbi:MAG: FAD-dependent oxidoreductase, partial [Ruminococcus sp.]|nr:FAD-dependent oxidoreductase [Ruminococcus sp.]
GQLTGVEGYMESASSGIIAGINAANKLLGKESVVLPKVTEIGALLSYITDKTVEKFQPMGANLGILPELSDRPRDKKLRAEKYAERALEALKQFITESDVI